MTAAEIDPAEIGEELLQPEFLQDFSRFRRHPGLSRAELACYFNAWVQRQLSAPVCMHSLRAGRVSALASISPAAWDSAHFGRSMFRIELLHDSETAVRELAQLVDSALEQVSAASQLHVSAEVDIDDYVALNALIGCGFEILDFKRTFASNHVARHAVYQRLADSIRPYHADDHEQVMALLDHVHFDTRFTRDPVLDMERSRQVYRLWFDSLLAEFPASSNALVCERGKRLVACGVIGEMDLFELGVARKLRTSSLYASGREGIGAYGAILYRLASEAVATHGLVETTISLNSPVATKVVEGIRPNKSVTRVALRLAR